MEDFIKIVSAVKDETRVMILKFLYTYGETCVCELQASFNMIQSRLSRHLLILKDAGFLKVRREGPWSYYCINSQLDDFRNCVIRQIVSLNISLPEKSSRC
jgi:ArsR family transcriptional regulator